MKHPPERPEKTAPAATARELPELERAAFAAAASGYGLTDSVVARLHCHYQELRRWNRRLSLVGPGTSSDVLGRHYGEALLALAEIPEATPGVLVDVGSGGGFPGIVLAACRPVLRVFLVESRARKAAFLRQAVASCGIEAKVVEGRIGRKLPSSLPETVDFLTVRGVRLELASWRALVARLSPTATVMAWSGSDRPALPSGLRARGSIPIVGSERRAIEMFSPEPPS